MQPTQMVGVHEGRRGATSEVRTRVDVLLYVQVQITGYGAVSSQTQDMDRRGSNIFRHLNIQLRSHA